MADEADIEDQIANGDSADDQAPSSVADLIRDINQNSGASPAPPTPDTQTPAPPDTPPATPKPAAPATPDVTPPASSTTPPAKTIPKDPEWANRNNKSQSTAGNEPAPKTGEPDKTGQPDPEVEQKTYGRLSELTGGAIKSEQDFNGFLTRYNELVQMAEEGFKPKFRNNAHKHAFDLLAGAPEGQELDVARRTLHTLSLDTSKLKGKDLLFEGFLLDPDNSDLSRQEAWDIFDAHYEKRFASAETDLLTKRELQKEERKAKEMIEKTQGDFKTASSKAAEEPQVDPKVMASVKKAVDEFGGIQMSFTENASENELLNIEVSDAEELAKLDRYVRNPQEYWNDLVQAHTTDNGFDYPGFVRTMYEHANIEKVKRLTYDHGYKQGKLAQLNKDRNSTPPGETVLDRSRVPAGPKKEAGSFHEAFEQALNKTQG